MSFRSIFSFLFLLLTFDHWANAQWSKVTLRTDVLETDNITDGFFVNRDTGFMVTANSVLYKTTDGGHQWSFDTVNFGGGTTRIFFPSPQVGYMLTQGGQYYGYGTILKTTDGGQTWFDVGRGNAMSMALGLYFFDNDTGMVITLSGFMFRTTDGGDTWSGNSIINGINVMDVNFVNDSFGFLSADCSGGDRSNLWVTYDKGNTWSGSLCPQGLFWEAKYSTLVDETTFIGYVYGSIPKLYKGQIDGSEITPVFPDDHDVYNPDLITSSNHFYRNIKFYDGGIGMLGCRNAIVATEDSGTTWQRTNIDDTTAYTSICPITGFVPITANHWLAFGKCGRVYVTQNKGGIWSSIKETKNDNSFSLIPNPATNTILLSNIAPHTPITITNLLGEVMLKDIAESERKEIDISRLPRGMYFINNKRFVKE